jgi:hypothetical protein
MKGYISGKRLSLLQRLPLTVVQFVCALLQAITLVLLGIDGFAVVHDPAIIQKPNFLPYLFGFIVVNMLSATCYFISEIYARVVDLHEKQKDEHD